MWKRIGCGLALLFLCGCFKTKDELTLNADGSGKARIETHSSLPPELSENMGMRGMGGPGLLYPPTSEGDARKFFPGNDFTVKVTQDRAENGEITTIVEAGFKDINALLASPYGRAHQLLVKIENGALVVKGVCGMEATARFAEMKDDSGMGMAAMPGAADLQKKKGEMRAEFRVTLPNPITDANGARDGTTASWIVERAKCKDAADFAGQLARVCEARCGAESVKMAPAAPTRLGLLPFAELAAGSAPSQGPAADTNKIAAAAKFVPYGLTVTRSLDLSGQGGSQENGAQLVGAVVLPQEYAPQKWGEATLEEVTDAKGNDLKPSDSMQDRMLSMRYRFSSMETGAEDEPATNAPSEQRHVVALAFRPPDWKVGEIARIKGSVTLQYFGAGSRIVKLTNAIPANWIMDPARMRSGSFDSSEKNLSSAQLSELGLTLSLQMGMTQSGTTALTFQAGGDQAALIDAQVFDADGKPWPTFLQQQEMGERGTCQIVVAGAPQPPLSLALVASGGGASVQVPILLEHVNLTK